MTGTEEQEGPRAACPEGRKPLLAFCTRRGVWRSRDRGRALGLLEREGAMTWIKPAFEEIKMDAEAKSYSDGLTW